MVWRFYVYELGDNDYIGKGCGSRLANQKRRYKLDGREIARFELEQDAYDFEVKLIAERKPRLNKCPGGNGSYASQRPCVPYSYRKSPRYKTRLTVARILLRKHPAWLMQHITEDDYRALKAVVHGNVIRY